ncbi:helix-turn-helix domain-containing protein [Pseudomonas sp. St316]|uniref:helix-turn-helix domain-containing protein n=1 Tax=Pseudomonas sp. St316 TaxID=2678257 RepID=UPI001BEEBD75|nr:helix-turn-helix domain-containing protein [Pseudomonas sp. St316]BBP57800.1 DNA-binding protein [Pseudomonas sp. St316]
MNQNAIDEKPLGTELTKPPILVVGTVEAARITAHSRSGIYRAIATGELQSFKAGKRRMILVSELEIWINRMARGNAR